MAWLLTAGAGCSNTYPPEPVGNTIRGTVAYHGSAHKTYHLPALDIAAFESYPPRGMPHAAVTILNPDFSDGPLSYALRDVPTYAYFLIAVIVEDEDHMDTGSGPLGGYPNMCVLQRATGNVVVDDDAPRENIDVVLYDNAGMSDPCFKEAIACPADDETAVVVTVQFTGEPVAPDDHLIFALFKPFPGPPRVVINTPGTALFFPEPQSVLLSSLEPNDYVAYVCLDRGGDDLQGLCGPEDSYVLFPNDGEDTFDFPVGKVVTLSVDLDTPSVTASTEDPDEACRDL